MLYVKTFSDSEQLETQWPWPLTFDLCPAGMRVCISVVVWSKGTMSCSHWSFCTDTSSCWISTLAMYVFKEIHTFIQQRCIKLTESDSKGIYNVTKLKVMCISNQFCAVLFYNKIYYGFHKNVKQHVCFNTDNNDTYFLNSKSVYSNDFWRSCDTEDWSNDAENTAAHHKNKLHFTIYSNRKHYLF